MGEINKKLCGKPTMTAQESTHLTDAFCEILKDLSPYDRNVIKDQRDILSTCIRALGEKGATELLGRLGVWMVLHNVRSAR
jgi:hypothetical protein